MTDRYYPALDEKTIKLISKLFQEDPAYFTDPKCPYSKEVIDLLSGKAEFLDYDSHASIENMKAEDIEGQLGSLYAKLQKYWEEVRNSDKAADKNTYFRVATSLMEKLVDLQERMSMVSQANKFTQDVLNIMDEVMTADQRNEITARLEKYKVSK